MNISKDVPDPFFGCAKYNSIFCYILYTFDEIKVKESKETLKILLMKLYFDTFFKFRSIISYMVFLDIHSPNIFVCWNFKVLLSTLLSHVRH